MLVVLPGCKSVRLWLQLPKPDEAQTVLTSSIRAEKNKICDAFASDHPRPKHGRILDLVVAVKGQTPEKVKVGPTDLGNSTTCRNRVTCFLELMVAGLLS